MRNYLKINVLQAATDLETVFGRAGMSNPAGIELTLDPTIETARHTAEMTDRSAGPNSNKLISDVYSKVKQRGLRLCSLTTDRLDLFCLVNPDDKIRCDAIERFTTLLQLAGQLDDDEIAVVIQAHAIYSLSDSLDWPYDDSYNRLFDALEQLADTAETYTAPLTLENPAAGLLLSPLEMRELADQVNSPYVTIAYNPNYAAHHGDAADWARIIGRRISMLRIGFDPPDADSQLDKWQAVTIELQKNGFAGPAVLTPR